MPYSAQRWEAWGLEFESQGHLRRAEWAFRRALQLSSPASTAYFNLGRVLNRRGRLAEAKANYARCLELKPDFYLCRVKFFELCREEYWTFRPEVLASIEQQLETVGASPELSIRRLHLFLSGGLFQQMRFEVARQDYDDLDMSVFERLERTQASFSGSRREAARYSQRLERTRELFQRLEQELADFRVRDESQQRRRARLSFKKEEPVDVVGLRDSDDLIAFHLEVISGGKLSFLGLNRIHKVEFGASSEFTEATLSLLDGSVMKVVVPGTYYGTHQSTLPELQRGEFTIFKDLYRGINMGVGRRVFRANSPNGEPTAISFHGLQTIEML